MKQGNNGQMFSAQTCSENGCEWVDVFILAGAEQTVFCLSVPVSAQAGSTFADSILG